MVSLLQTYEKQEDIFLNSCLEICCLYGLIDILIENIDLYVYYWFLFFTKSYFLLFNEYEGIKTLIELPLKDYQNYILNTLIQISYIQKL